MLVPADGGASRFVQYYYDGSGFTEDQGGSAVGTPEPVDLAEVDVGRLADNLAVARDTLGVEDAEVARVLIADDVEAGFSSDVESGRRIPAHVEISVTNEYSEDGTLVTDLGGTEVLVEHPHDPDPGV